MAVLRVLSMLWQRSLSFLWLASMEFLSDASVFIVISLERPQTTMDGWL